MAAATVTMNFFVQCLTLLSLPPWHPQVESVQGAGGPEEGCAPLRPEHPELPPRVQRNKVMDPGEDQSHRIHPGPGQ